MEGSGGEGRKKEGRKEKKGNGMGGKRRVEGPLLWIIDMPLRTKTDNISQRSDDYVVTAEHRVLSLFQQ